MEARDATASRGHRSLNDPAAPWAVVVVSYQSAADLPGCLGSLPAAAAGHPLEVIVVDNASTDGSAEVAAAGGAVVLANPCNVGYSRAANAGIRRGSGEWVLLLNADTVLPPGALAALVATGTADPAIGCVGPLLHDRAGQAYPTGRRFPGLLVGVAHALLGTVWPGNPATRRYHDAGADRSRAVRVDWVSGACLLLRRAAFDSIGGFDPGYFMFAEDMDLCLRLARTGWGVVLDPRVDVEHAVGGSTRKAPYRKVWNHHMSMLRFYRRRYAGDPRLVLTPLAAAFLALRAALSAGRTALGTRAERRREVRADEGRA